MKKILKWLDNYWYHYKWITILVAVFAAILIICIANTGSGIEDDIQIVYAGPTILTDIQLERMERSFADLLKEDLNGDGKKSVNIVNITVMSDEQLKAAEEEAKKEGQTLIYDPSLRTQALTQMKSLMSTGAVIICILDPFVYESCEEGTFITLESVLGKIPENACDEYSIRFFDTDFADAYDSFSVLTEDLLLCIRNDVVITTNNKHFQKEYAWHKTYFADLAEFSVG